MDNEKCVILISAYCANIRFQLIIFLIAVFFLVYTILIIHLTFPTYITQNEEVTLYCSVGCLSN